MGTRGITGFVVKGEVKVGYQQYDSYPSGVGVKVLQWLRGAVQEPEALLDRVLNLQVVTEVVVPTPDQIEALAPFTDLGVSTGTTSDWYCLLRDTQGDPEKILKAGYILDAHEFAKDSLFCEWGYLVDLDHLTFEVYRGFQRSKHALGRFASDESDGDGYYPIRLVKSYPLTSLPNDDEFVALEEQVYAAEAVRV